MTNISNTITAFDEAMAFINSYIATIPEEVIPERKELLHRCQDGSIVDIHGVSTIHPKMDDRHLLNTIRYIRRFGNNGFVLAKYIKEYEYRKSEYAKGKQTERSIK